MSPVGDMISGALSSVGNGYIDDGVDNIVLKIASSAVLGGTISKIGGGKFANGAVTGAYSMLFNGLMHLDLNKKFNEELKKTRDFCVKRRQYYEQMMRDVLSLSSSPESGVDAVNAVSILMLDEFVSLVKTGGKYDLKSDHNSEFSITKLKNKNAIYNGESFQAQDFGNYNFGVAAKAFGLSLTFSRMGAGLYQIFSRTSNIRWISSYFDDPRDSKMISRGYNHFK